MFIKKNDRIILSETNQFEVINPQYKIFYSVINIFSQFKIFSDNCLISPNGRDWYEDLVIDLRDESAADFDFCLKPKESTSSNQILKSTVFIDE